MDRNLFFVQSLVIFRILNMLHFCIVTLSVFNDTVWIKMCGARRVWNLTPSNQDDVGT